MEWENKADWEEVDGVWVPSHYESYSPAGPFFAVTRKTSVDYHWESVNQPVDPTLFAHQRLPIPKDVGIYDVSGGAPVWIREPSRAPQPRAGSIRPERIVPVLVFAAVLLLLTVALVWRRVAAARGRH